MLERQPTFSTSRVEHVMRMTKKARCFFRRWEGRERGTTNEEETLTGGGVFLFSKEFCPKPLNPLLLGQTASFSLFYARLQTAPPDGGDVTVPTARSAQPLSSRSSLMSRFHLLQLSGGQNVITGSKRGSIRGTSSHLSDSRRQFRRNKACVLVMRII